MLLFEDLLLEIAFVAGDWITPQGRVVSLHPDESHFSAILRSPSVFGTFPKGMLMGQVLDAVLKRGFVQVRDYSDWYQVDVMNLNSKSMDLIYDYAIAGGFGSNDGIPITISSRWPNADFEVTAKRIKQYDFDIDPSVAAALG